VFQIMDDVQQTETSRFPFFQKKNSLLHINRCPVKRCHEKKRWINRKEFEWVCLWINKLLKAGRHFFKVVCIRILEKLGDEYLRTVTFLLESMFNLKYYTVKNIFRFAHWFSFIHLFVKSLWKAPRDLIEKILIGVRLNSFFKALKDSYTIGHEKII
jgi:hypothetical protein